MPSLSGSSLHRGLISADSWIAKVISTVFALAPPHHAVALLSPLRHALTPLSASEALLRLREPQLSLSFLSLTSSAFGIRHLPSAYLSVARALCLAGHRHAAIELFDQMLAVGHPPDPAFLDLLIVSHMRASDSNTALALIRRATGYGVSLHLNCFTGAIKLLMARGRIRDALGFFFEQLGSSAFAPDTYCFNVVIKGLCRLGDVEQAMELLNGMRRYDCCPDTITYNTIIDAFCKSDRVERGHEMLAGLLQSDHVSCPPSVATYTSIIRGYCKKGAMQEAYGLFRGMVNHGIRPNTITYNVMIDGYGKAGDMGMAISMYEEMAACGCSPDRVTFTSLIDGCCRDGQVDDAFRFYYNMKDMGISPNAYAFAILINALSKQNRLSEARSVLMEMMERKDILPRPFMFNPVLDVLCKMGNVDEANTILAQMKDCGCSPDKITYTVMMIGYCMKGRMFEAIAFFDNMMMNGCIPDERAISSLVISLLKGGRPDEAKQITAAYGKGQVWAPLHLIRISPISCDNNDTSVVI